MLSKDLGDNIKDLLASCLESLKKDNPSVIDISIQLEIPKEKTHGDLSTNLAFRLSKHLKEAPLKIAHRLSDEIKPLLKERRLSSMIEKVEVKPPGFINFWFGKKYLYDVLLEIEKRKDRFGSLNIGRGKSVQIEFVSANPTGPLTIAHGRQAAVGDSLANILTHTNHRVTREYYVNDEGTQIGLLARSIKARYLELLGRDAEFPEKGYKGDYIIDIARGVRDKYGEKKSGADIEYFKKLGMDSILEMIKKDLLDFGVKFNVWSSQKAITGKGKIKKTLDYLKKKDYIYEKDGAMWFKSKAMGDDKDRVVIKSDGSYTYLAPDIAYHKNKFERGFKKVINIWGPDHHGYIARLKAAIKALGYNREDVSILLVQLATLYRGTQVIPMSTREGQFITLRQVMDEVGRDAARFFFLTRKTNSHLDFDLELAKKTSMENPVYYIQYGYARTANILEFAKEKCPKLKVRFDPNYLKTPLEIAVLKSLRKFPYSIMACCENLEPYYLISYMLELSSVFHRFYTGHRVVTDDPKLTCARLKLVRSTKDVFLKGLSLLGVSQPEKM